MYVKQKYINKDSEMTRQRYSLAIVQTHATQFDGPLFKRLSRNSDIELTVYYTVPSGKAPSDKELGRSPDWDNEVVTGYFYKTSTICACAQASDTVHKKQALYITGKNRKKGSAR